MGKALLYSDYAVTWAAKVGGAMSDLHARAPPSIFAALWTGDARQMGAFENLKALADLRKWHENTEVRALVKKETGVSL